MKDKIMVVDDEEHIRMLYSEELADEGYQVVTVSNGFRLLQKIEREKPTLVILDIRLADYNGLDLLQSIRERFDDLPVGFCTAYDTFKEDTKSASADFYVVRSFDLTELKKRIASTIEIYRQKEIKHEFI
ncbi:MAG: response regulator [Deltaproteobacteria bacterium]|nr:response regulator [Deltaproteobacteria bacterium]